MNNLVRKISILSAVSVVMACNPQGSQLGLSNQSSLQVDSQKEALVSFKLTDAPNEVLKSVFVNIDHMEVVVAGSGKAGRLTLAQDLGMVDLLQLQNGVTLPLKDVVAPAGLQIQQIRLVLKKDGHYIVKSDDSICELKTPSAQKTGVKIILTNKVQFEAGHQYSIVVDFDAKKSVVLQGNGGCLLKPVLKLKSAYKSPIVVDEPGAGAGTGEDSGSGEVVGGDTGSGSGEVVGGDTGSGTDVGAGDGSSSGGSETGGEELVTDPDANSNDSGTNDGWDDSQPISDGWIPGVTEEQLYQLL